MTYAWFDVTSHAGKCNKTNRATRYVEPCVCHYGLRHIHMSLRPKTYTYVITV